MLSILIPTYNHDITLLVKNLKGQLDRLAITYEIIVADDCSTKTKIIEKNKQINIIPNCTLLQNEFNQGRTATRLNLAKKAKFNWLLFLDADVIPLRDDFIYILMKNLNDDIDFIFGGIHYRSKKPKDELILRWIYGHKKEMKNLKHRKKNPYSSIISQNFLVKKHICIDILNSIQLNRYGLDIMFTNQLKKKNIRVLHIDNPTIHIGLEDNISFFKKSLESIETTFYFQKQEKFPDNYRPIQISYLALKRFYGIPLFYFLINTYKKYIIKNITSKKPSLFLFDLYRLYHYIKIQKSPKG